MDSSAGLVERAGVTRTALAEMGGFDAVRQPDGVGSQVDARCTRTVNSFAFQEVQEVLLARLPEGEPVEGEVILEGHHFGGIPAKRIVDEMTLDLKRAGIDPVGRELAELGRLVAGSVVGGFPRVRFRCEVITLARWRAAMLRRTAWPPNLLTRPSRCSKSTGLAGGFQCTTAWHHQWKSMPSWPTLVVVSTNGQNGLLNALRTCGCRTLSSSWRLLP